MKKIIGFFIIYSIGIFTGGEWTRYLYKPVVNGCYDVVRANHDLLDKNSDIIARQKRELKDLESQYSRLNEALGIISSDKNK